MMRCLESLIVAVLVIFYVRCESENSDVCATRACEREAENILAKLDESVDPCDDFYLFACGSFLNITQIPDDKTSVDVTTQLEDTLIDQLSEVLNSSISNEDIHAIVCSKKLYKACLDEDLIERRGIKPIRSVIESLGGWPILEGNNWADNIWFWQKILLSLELAGFNSDQMFSLSIDADMKNTTRRMFYIDQPGLGIEREYLINGFEDDIVQAYYNYHVDTAVYFGADRFNAEIEVKDVLNFEIEMAKILIPKEERRNMTLMYNPMRIREFQHLFPIHDWYKYINELMAKVDHVSEDEEIVLTDFKFIVEDFNKLIVKTPNRVIVNYLMWRIVSSVTDMLNKDIRERSLIFSKVRSGKKSFQPRWRECIDIVLEVLPIATSALYVRNFFKNESREIALEMVSSIRDEFVNILSTVPWMDESTREAALEKAKAMVAHIGYPDELMDDSKLNKYYEGLTIDEEKYFESVLNNNKFDSDKIYRKLRKPVNKMDWETHSGVAEVNAFYNPPENSIQFPAGILQGIFFSSDRPQYLNYGSIGSVIGHEITHGFDDEGSQFDSLGNLVEWWAEDTKDAYLEKAQCIIDQYDNFTEPNVDLKLNGINTQGENIADNGGIKEAYFAYRKFVQEKGAEQILPGLNYSTNQLFWISAAQSWCSVSRSERMKLLINTNSHSPEMFRVIGPFGNMKEFSQDFQCTEDSPMNPTQKCEVW